MASANTGVAPPAGPRTGEGASASPGFAPGARPVLDPLEPLSPELVLVAPELRTAAVARLRAFPTAPRATAEERPPRPVEAPPPHARRSRRRVAVVAAAAVGAVAAAALLGQAIAGDGPPRLEPARPAAGAAGGAGAPRPRAAIRDGATKATEHPAKRVAGTAKKRSAPSPALPRHSRVQAERNVLASAHFFATSGPRAAAVVDAATGVFLTNTRVRCAASPGSAPAHAFTCTVRHGNAVVRVRYVATGGKTFRLGIG